MSERYANIQESLQMMAKWAASVRPLLMEFIPGVVDDENRQNLLDFVGAMDKISALLSTFKEIEQTFFDSMMVIQRCGAHLESKLKRDFTEKAPCPPVRVELNHPVHNPFFHRPEDLN